MKKIVIMLSIIIGVVFTIAISLVGKKIISEWKATQKNQELMEKYAVILNDYQIENETPSFALTYIDNDNIPELVLYSDYYGFTTTVAVYTIYNGEVIFVGNYGTYAELLYGYKSSLIIDYDPKYGDHYGIFSLKDGVATKIGQFDGNIPRMWYREDDKNYYDEDTNTYYIDGVIVSEDVFFKSSVYLVNDIEVTQQEYVKALGEIISDNTIYIAGSAAIINENTIVEMISSPESFVEIGNKTSVPHDE